MNDVLLHQMSLKHEGRLTYHRDVRVSLELQLLPFLICLGFAV